MVAPPAARRPWPVRRTFPVTYHDLDVLNHLNHAAYLPMMETLRCEYYLGLLGTDDPSRLDIIVAEAACRYLAPVGYGAVLLGSVVPVRPLGRTSFTLAYRFEEAAHGRPTAVGRTVIVTYDYAAGRKTEIPAERRRRLEEDAVSEEETGWGPPPHSSSGNRGVGVEGDHRGGGRGPAAGAPRSC
jgi:acyl-CoA thioester hydrolase